MPWAANGQISTSPIHGGIEISEADYQAALAGMASGRVVSTEGDVFALVEPPPPDPEPEPALPDIDDYRRAVQAHVDATAQERQYDGGHTCATYLGSSNPVWAAEAQAFVSWRDAVWGYAFAELGRVQNGERPQPTIEDFLEELPPIVWDGYSHE